MLSSSDKSTKSPQKIQNNFFDEAMELSETSSTNLSMDMKPQPGLKASLLRGDSPPTTRMESEDGYDEEVQHLYSSANTISKRVQDVEDSEDEFEFNQKSPILQAHTELESESTAGDLKKLMDYIDMYSPMDIELTPTLQVFVPEWLPCIGDLDAFIKIAKPNHENDTIGLTVLDEPASEQTDPSSNSH
jgi:intraflagellar transport protein 46